MTAIDANEVNDAGSHARMTELIAAGIGQAQELIGILTREQQALSACDSDALALLIADKQARIARLNELDVDLRDALARRGFSASQTSVTSFLAHGDSTGVAAGNWRMFTQLLRHARRQNRINGGALGAQRHHVEHTLRLLRGGAPAAQYGRAGMEPGFDPRRTLGRV